MYLKRGFEFKMEPPSSASVSAEDFSEREKETDRREKRVLNWF